MKFRTLIRRSLRFHWRSHLGVMLGAAIGSAALIGALVVGDSVRESLRERALQRLPDIWAAMNTGDRFLHASLLERIHHVSTNQYPIPQPNVTNRNITWGTFAGTDSIGFGAIQLAAAVSRSDETHRANNIILFGIDRGFAQRMFRSQNPQYLTNGGVILNAALAQRLDAHVGDELIFRVPKITALSRESAVAQRGDAGTALRSKVAKILPRQLGNLSFQPGQSVPLNAFVYRDELAARAGGSGGVNLLLARPASHWRTANFLERFNFYRRYSNRGGLSIFRNFEWVKAKTILAFPASSIETAALASELFDTAWTLSDVQYQLAAVASGSDFVELKTPRVFLDPPVVQAALAADTNAQPFLTYLANLLRAGTNATPYSMVTAAGAAWTPAGMRDDEIVVSQWLAEDLQVKPGDELALSYFLPESGARLEEATNTFRVRSIVPMEMPWADRTLMPDFPGIEKAESTRDWDAGFPLAYEIRKQDDDYWKQHRGTPKAFITLAAGQKMWGNRFGNLTAIRFLIPTNLVSSTTALTPALSPGERENRSPLPGESKAGNSSAGSGKSNDGQQPSPLPGGEGQGEGERKTNWVGTRSTASQTSSPKDGDAVERVPTNAEEYRAALEKKILANLKPEELGLRFEPVREQALKAAEESQDFGGLFLGFSFFLIAAALLLMAMLFQFGLEQRAPEIGTLLALGFTPKQVRKLLLREGMALAFLGGVIGAVGGIYFAKAMLHGLTTVWRDAVGATALHFHVTAQTLVIGLFASVVVSVITIWLALRKFVKREPRELLAGDTGAGEFRAQRLSNRFNAPGALVAALGIVAFMLMKGDTANAGAFFGAGALVLLAGLGFVSAWLRTMERRPPTGWIHCDVEDNQRAGAGTLARITLSSLALRGCARRRKRSLGTVAMLACGSFLVVSIGVFRLDANRDATQKTSGTGGFALMGETTMPVVQDLNTKAGREFFALNEDELKGVNVVPFRVREGDEASCLNLNAAQEPRLLGVKPELLGGRFEFAKGDGWKALNEDGRWRVEDGKDNPQPNVSVPSSIRYPPSPSVEIPAIGDANSIQWAMKKKVGDAIDYVDERGQPFKVRIVGAVANSILQGQLIIDEAEFVKRFPGESGYRMFLIDAPTNRVTEVSTTLSRAMQDVGLELTPAPQRLAQFNAVQNTYLGTFQVLGGLGLLLGSVGLGIVVLRNVLERRGELAVLMAVGFRKPQVQRLLLIENGALLALGLGVGVVAAAVAVLPAVLSPSAQLPIGSLTLTLAAVFANGAVWTWAATSYAVRGDLLQVLRNE